MGKSYIPRFADALLESALRRSGAVLIEGPKGCGKTETALQRAQSVTALDPGSLDLATANLDPHLILPGSRPRLIDEWQNAPAVWDVVRREVDSSRDKGAFILTGSTVPSEDAARHSGAGRFARLRMSTMTFAETKHSTAEASFNALLDGQDILLAAPDFSVLEVIERMTQGGWPAYLNLSNEDARESIIDYVADVSAVDVRTPDRTFRDSTKVSTLLRSLSRGIGTEITVSTLAADTGLSRDTVRDYLDALSRIFIHVEQPAWSAHLRSTATLRKAPKRHLADPALAVALLCATPQQILRDLGFAGQLFESQVYHDICALMGRGALISHARDSVGCEVDLVVERGDGRWALIEVKLGSSDETIEGAAASLKRFERQLDFRGYEYHPELVVITATGPSYQRKDGVHVVAFTALAQ